MDSLELEEHAENALTLKSLIWDTTELRVGRWIRISFMILSLQQMMGINLLVYYSTRIFANIGYSDFLSQLLAAVMNTGFAIGTYPLPWTIERFGRRPIMIWCAVGCFVSMMIFTIMISLKNPTIATSWTAVAFVIIYNFVYGYGWTGGKTLEEIDVLFSKPRYAQSGWMVEESAVADDTKNPSASVSMTEKV
ncbi:hypothetical protein F5884DRAFT_862482 [Xylogone sp. PMI_703]|nr:hypothetical protein F5884DRAFT_862482 [Xylogone sp. PMI_703]